MTKSALKIISVIILGLVAGLVLLIIARDKSPVNGDLTLLRETQRPIAGAVAPLRNPDQAPIRSPHALVRSENVLSKGWESNRPLNRGLKVKGIDTAELVNDLNGVIERALAGGEAEAFGLFRIHEACLMSGTRGIKIGGQAVDCQRIKSNQPNGKIGWLKSAAEKGSVPAMVEYAAQSLSTHTLDRALASQTGKKSDRLVNLEVTTLRYLNASAQQGVPVALEMLFNSYANGHHGELSPPRAYVYGAALHRSGCGGAAFREAFEKYSATLRPGDKVVNVSAIEALAAQATCS